MNQDKDTNNNDFQTNQDQIIADAARNIVNEQGQLFPQTPTPENSTLYPVAENIENPQTISLPEEFQPTPESQQTQGSQNQVAPEQFVNTVSGNNVNDAKKHFKLPKTRRNILIALAGILIFSGLLVGLVISANAMFNKPETVVAKSIMNTTKADYFNAVKTNINVTNANGSSVSFYAIGGQKDSLTRADFNLRYAVFNIDGSFMYDGKDEASYFKVNGLSDLAKAFNAPVKEDQNLDSWVKLIKTDIAPASQSVGLKTENGDINPMVCVQAMSKYIQTDEFKTKLSETYNSNQFADIQKVGTETVDGQKTGKYQVTVNNDSFDLFFTDLSNNALKPKMAAIDPGCNTESDASIETVDSGMKIKNVFVWVNSKKQLLQIAGEVSSGSATASIQFNLINDNKLDYTIPTSSVDSIEKLFGI